MEGAAGCTVSDGDVDMIVHGQQRACGDFAADNAASALGGDIGRSVRRRPVACRTAFATAASGGTIGTSPTPRTPCGCLSLGTSISTGSIIGRSEATGMR